MTDLDISEIEMVAQLSQWTPRQPGEFTQQYGARLVAHLMATALTACLSDEDLELARHTIIGLYDGQLSDCAIASLRQTEALITCMVKGRAARQPAQDGPSASPSAPSKPNLGPMAPLAPQPVTRPPAPSAAVPDFSF